MLKQEREIIERSTYSLLDLLGDVGGLFDGLRYLAWGLITPIGAFKMKAELLNKAFKILESQQKDKKEHNYLVESRSDMLTHPQNEEDGAVQRY